jgi:MFS superfamily sulfate permease-like transporter
MPVDGFLIVRPNVPLTFVNADVAKDQIVALIRSRGVAPGVLVLDIGATADLDVATTDMLSTLVTNLRGDGIQLRLAQVRSSVRDRMRQTGLIDVIGEERCFYSVEAAVAASGTSAAERDTPAIEAPA